MNDLKFDEVFCALGILNTLPTDQQHMAICMAIDNLAFSTGETHRKIFKTLESLCSLVNGQEGSITELQGFNVSGIRKVPHEA